MRSPVIAFGLFAAAAVSPTLVGAAPASPNIPANSLTQHPAPGLPAVPGDSATSIPHVGRDLSGLNDSHKARKSHKHGRRDEDSDTAGGNAYSGVSGNVSGGNTLNDAGNNEDTLANTDSSKFGTFVP
jgi:hypothetical protein